MSLASQPTTLLQEMSLAARGVLALARGDRQAANYFDFSQRGLVGSFIAFIGIVAFMAVQPLFTGNTGGVSVASRLFTLGLPVLAQFVGAAIALNQMGRPDGFVPYLVCANWTSFVCATASELLLLIGLDPGILVMVIGIFTLLVSVNIARLVVTLTVWQIVAFFVTQMIAVLFSLLILGLFMPPPPEAVEAAAEMLRQ